MARSCWGCTARATGDADKKTVTHVEVEKGAEVGTGALLDVCVRQVKRETGAERQVGDAVHAARSLPTLHGAFN